METKHIIEKVFLKLRKSKKKYYIKQSSAIQNC